jgi:hypothetical protein
MVTLMNNGKTIARLRNEALIALATMSAILAGAAMVEWWLA